MFPGPPRTAWTTGFVAALLIGGGAAPCAAQFPPSSTCPLGYVDARVLPPGALHIGFLPSCAHYDTRFDSSGTIEPLGRSLSPNTAGSNFLPSLAAAEAAVRGLTRDSTYRMGLGKGG